MDKISVLFVCIHNSARSQMAEELLRKLGGDRFEVESAGIEPGVLNPLVVDVLKEVGIDISNKETKSVFDLYKSGRLFNYVITVCDESSAEGCPVFAGICTRLHWSFSDPSKFEGTRKEKVAKIKEVRNQIEGKINTWLDTL